MSNAGQAAQADDGSYPSDRKPAHPERNHGTASDRHTMLQWPFLSRGWSGVTLRSDVPRGPMQDALGAEVASWGARRQHHPGSRGKLAWPRRWIRRSGRGVAAGERHMVPLLAPPWRWAYCGWLARATTCYTSRLLLRHFSIPGNIAESSPTPRPSSTRCTLVRKPTANLRSSPRNPTGAIREIPNVWSAAPIDPPASVAESIVGNSTTSLEWPGPASITFVLTIL